MKSRTKIGFFAAIAVALGTAACSKSGGSMDDGLKQDLAAAKTAATSRVSISPLELGERSAPAPQARAPKPVVKHNAPPVAAPTHVAQTPPVEAAPQPAPVQQQPAPAPQKAEQPAAAQPRPAPVQAQGEEHHGKYKSEAAIFRQMPWIKP